MSTEIIVDDATKNNESASHMPTASSSIAHNDDLSEKVDPTPINIVPNTGKEEACFQCLHCTACSPLTPQRYIQTGDGSVRTISPTAAEVEQAKQNLIYQNIQPRSISALSAQIGQGTSKTKRAGKKAAHKPGGKSSAVRHKNKNKKPKNSKKKSKSSPKKRKTGGSKAKGSKGKRK